MMSGVSDHKKSLTVKIQLPEDSENILAVNFPNTFDVGSLKDDIAKKFKISSEQLVVYQEEEIYNGEKLCNLHFNDFGIIELNLRLSDDAINSGTRLDTSVYYSSFTLPDIITVHIPVENEAGEETTRDLVVEIENKSIKKPFLGGYVHKKTSKIDVPMGSRDQLISVSDIEYHHAFTQTGPAFEKIKDIRENKLCRETQTIEMRRSAVVSFHGFKTKNFFLFAHISIGNKL